MRFQFDPDQPHQLDAIAAVVDALPLDLTDDEALHAGVQAVRARNGLAPLSQPEGRDLTIEMETGTGKTYTYLRTMRELHARFGLARFVVVAPGVAIREGVLQQLEVTAEHLRGLYGDTHVEATVVRPGQWGDLRRFASDDAGLQILVINIDAFNKRASNLIHRRTDALGGRRPIELLAACHPVVVLDEPQSLSGPRAVEAIESLAPLLTLRYSATHRHAPNLLYRLDPVTAHDAGLVKGIEVLSVTAEAGAGPAPVELVAVAPSRGSITARIKLDVAEGGGLVRRTLVARAGAELFTLSGGREVFRGVTVDEIDADAQQVSLSNGDVLRIGDGAGAAGREAVMRRQIEETVRAHLDTERRIRRLLPPGESLKVLSLFFVERVAHYADEDGPVRLWFEEAWRRLAALPEFAPLSLPPVDRVHAGYFAHRKGKAVDTSGRSRDDEAAFELIMRDKARLLSPEEPVRCLFSHSALRQGWDNPNVFQICTLHPTRSELRKRQEIGRGLRIPVLASGRRCFDPDIARLVLVANESYEAFARALQTEIQKDCGVDFGARVVDRRAPAAVSLRRGFERDPHVKELWAAIARPLRPRAALDRDALVARAAASVAALPSAAAPGITVTVARGEILADQTAAPARVATHAVAAGAAGAASTVTTHSPDPLRHLQAETGLTRRTLVAVLTTSGRLDDLAAAPLGFLEACAHAIRAALDLELTRGTSWAVAEDAGRPLADLADRPLKPGRRRLVRVSHSAWTHVPVRDAGEERLVTQLDRDPSVRCLLPWPAWLAIPTPLGPFEPGWAVLGGSSELVAARPARPSDHPAAVACGERALAALGVGWRPLPGEAAVDDGASPSPS